MALDSTYAHLPGFLPERAWRRIIDLLVALGLPVYAPRARRARCRRRTIPTSVLGGLAEFREHLGGQLTIMLLEDIGQPFDVHEIRPDL